MSGPAERTPAADAMARADFVTSLVLIGLGAGALVLSLRMPRFQDLNIEPYTAPGLVPGVLGAVILLLGGVLCLRAARAGGGRLAGGRDRPTWLADAGARRLLLAVVLTLGYAAGLVGRLPFWLATWLFVTAFVALFEWPLAASSADRRRRLTVALIYGGLVAAAVGLVFQRIFLVRLP